jgi:hypothetical protein
MMAGVKRWLVAAAYFAQKSSTPSPVGAIVQVACKPRPNRCGAQAAFFNTRGFIDSNFEAEV